MSKSDESPAATIKVARPKPETKSKVEQMPPFNVVLLNDEEHSYEYVIEMLVSLFNHTPERSFQLTQQVDETGRAIVFTTHKEHAELKADQIHGFGVDIRCANCKGGMSAVVEAAN